MENYTRVIPRDFFNEAKLLKCMGQLALKVHDRQLPEGVNIEISESGEPFDIQLTDEGNLLVANYRTKVNGTEVTFATSYNSKSAFPLLCCFDYCEYAVFTESGEFDSEFIDFAHTLKN